MNIFLFSIGINTAYFLADFFIKLGSYHYSAGRLVYIRSILTVLFSLIWLSFTGAIYQLPTGLELAQLLGCGTLCVLGLFFYVRALQGLHFVNVSVLGISGALIHYLLGILLNHEQFNPWFYVAAALCVSGIGIQWKKQEQHKGLIDASLSAIFWGFGYALLNIPLQSANPVWGAFILEFTALVLSGMYIFRFEPNAFFSLPKLRDYRIFLVALFTVLGSVWINYAYQKFNLSALGFMQLAFFPYSMLAGFLVFKEKLSRIEWIGNGLVMLGLLFYFAFI